MHKTVFIFSLLMIASAPAQAELRATPIQVFGQRSFDAAAMAPDGSRFAASSHNAIHIIDIQTGALLRTYVTGHTATIRCLAVSSDWKKMLTGSDDKTVKLWDMNTGALLRTINESAALAAIALSPDQSKILTLGSESTRPRLWNAATGALIHEFPSSGAKVTQITFSPDGGQIMTVAEKIRTYETATRSLLLELDGTKCAAYTPNGKQIMGAGVANNWIAKLWDASTGAHIQNSQAGISMEQIVFSPTGSLFLTTNRTGIYLFNFPTGTMRSQYGYSLPSYATFLPGESELLTLRYGTVYLININGGAIRRSYPSLSHWSEKAVLSPDGNTMLSAYDTTITLWSSSTGLAIRSFGGHRGYVTSLAFSPTSPWVASGSTDHTARIWEAITGEQVRILYGHHGEVNCVAFSPDGTKLLTGSKDRTAILWDTATGNILRTFSGQAEPILSVAFSPNGTQVLTASSDYTTQLWDPATGSLLRTYFGHFGPVNAVACSPSGDFVLTGSSDQAANLWYRATGRLMKSFEHASGVDSVAYFPDNLSILTGSTNNDVRIWDIASGNARFTFPKFDYGQISMSADGRGVLVYPVLYELNDGTAQNSVAPATWNSFGN